MGDHKARPYEISPYLNSIEAYRRPLIFRWHTIAIRLSAGGVADYFVTLMLRQGDAQVFRKYSQAKLNMVREAPSKLDRQANEHRTSYVTAGPNCRVLVRFCGS